MPIAERAKRYVGEGFDGLWAFHAVGRGFMAPDPFVILAVAATATEQVELGTAIVQVPLYEPVDLAHRVLSLMQVCGDRLTLGVGAGSTEADFRTFERDYPGRFRTFNQNLARLRFCSAKGGRDDLGPTAELLGRYAEAGFDDAIVMMLPGGPDPKAVRALLP